MNTIICLTEKKYWHGVAALLDALVTKEFKGRIYIGYRGEVPVWINKYRNGNEAKFNLKSEIEVILRQINTHRHFGYHKAFFINEIIEETNPEKIFYFDVDCIPLTSFTYFENWTENHISLCMDECYTQIHENHPWKIYWKSILLQNGHQTLYLNNPYINSGYLGIPQKYFSLINTWITLTQYLEINGLNTHSFHKTPINAIQGDQEILNMALCTVCASDISVIGKEGMGFQDPIYLMVHCTSKEKPWDKNFLLSTIKTGLKISVREKIFFRHLNNNFKSFSAVGFFIKKTNLKLAEVFTRIF